MHFLVQFQDKTQQIVSTSSWAACLAYAEGTAKGVQVISEYDESKVNFVINNINGICFDISLKSNATGMGNLYVVFDVGFNEVQSWILAQQGKTLVNLTTSQKTYVTV